MFPNIISHLNLTATSKITYYSSYIIDEETEGQSGCVAFARPHRQGVAKPGIPGKGNTMGSLSLQLNVTKGIVQNEDDNNFLPRNVFNFTLGFLIGLV